ncbi:tyrosine-type recombinase/integrase [Bradyrhizobium monzae]|uniref:tyrosine-type recombinase/integrase n=1 Tax=Bradyrhizobium sp. Oc8 TaxID=2876780 RepID=UPI001F421A9B
MFKSAVRLAGLGPGISPHTLRHTAASWLIQRGADRWQAARYLGMSLEVLPQHLWPPSPWPFVGGRRENRHARVDRRTKGARISGAVSGAVIPIRRNST